MKGSMFYGKEKRNGLIEFLRFFFCLIIVFRHGNIFCPEGGMKYFQRGALGVDFFFLVSGYLMVCSALKFQTLFSRETTGKLTADFLKRKIKALCPELPIAFVIAFFVSAAARDNFTVSGIISSLNDWIWEWLLIPMAGFATGSMHMGVWYISAMLLAMLILFPICVKYFDMFTKVLAPIIALFILGGLALSTGTTLGPSHILGNVVYKGMIRALGEVALGAACYPLIEYLKKVDFSSFAKYLIDIITFVCVVLSSVWMIFGDNTKYDMACVLVITVIVCLSFSHQGRAATIFDNRFCCMLGRLSLPIYLGHAEWAKAVKIFYKERAVAGAYSLEGFWIMTAAYLALTAATVCIICLVSWLYRKNREKITAALRKLFLRC